MTVPSSTPASYAPTTPTVEQRYEYPETRALVELVNDAAELVHSRGEAAFADLAVAGSRWRRDETYIFVLAPDGKMLVHPDPSLEGHDLIDLKDVAGKPIIRGLIAAVTAFPGKPQGWHHYQWPVPDGLLPRWKSSYVRLVETPSGKQYIVGCGVYNDRMERAFVVDMVTSAVALVEAQGSAAFPALRDPTGPFRAKDAYVFVIGLDGVELVNPLFPTMEGRYTLDMKDVHGEYKHREMVDIVRARGAGWIDYSWPKPGESVATRKSAYASAATVDGKPMLVGCGVYLADAPKESRPVAAMTARELMTLVRDAAAVFEEQGENAYAAFRTPGSRWFHDDVYFYVVTMDGMRTFVATEPENEGKDSSGRMDMLGRPYGAMILDIGRQPAGEGWIHYMYPLPGTVYPAWKSAFLKRVTFPSGTQHIIGCGIYNMQMDDALIEDVVDRAAALVAERGKDAFAAIRDRTGPFVFMDTYVFVVSTDGLEMVNPAQPSLEGRNVLALRDLEGRASVKDEIAAALAHGRAWTECTWYRPGDNTPARKRTFVRSVSVGAETYIVGSGIYGP